MRYAIVINLDYDSNPATECHRVWDLIKAQMQAVGFRLEGRVFTTDLPITEACDAARAIMNALDEHPTLLPNGVFMFLKEFYGYDHGHSVNLLLPPSDNIELIEA